MEGDTAGSPVEGKCPILLLFGMQAHSGFY